ncbi:MAG: GGDEF domain-containing protein [Gemmiger sp.]|nr:GGDEF domain-containing protein [Gemmiger sp.]
MLAQLKNWWLRWAYLDFAQTGSRSQTCFYRYPQELTKKNLTTMKSLCKFFCLISLVVTVAAQFLRPGQYDLTLLYGLVLVLQVLFFGVATHLLKHPPAPRLGYVVTELYLFHLLALSGVVGVIFSPNESGTVFMVVLVISQLLFILPPLHTTLLSGLALAGVLVGSYFYKPDYFFRADVLNGVGVYLLSILMGWMAGRLQLEEAYARTRATRLNNELQRLSRTDQQTGLRNHRSFVSDYEALTAAAQAEGAVVGVIMMDVDRFKLYNDHYGHIKGDRCLHEVGQALAALQRPQAMPYRFGGEEFVVLLHRDACARAAQIAEQCRAAVAALGIPHRYGPALPLVTVSVGVYVGRPQPGDGPYAPVERADRAMYHSKAAGGNQVTVYDPWAVEDAPAFDEAGEADEAGAECKNSENSANGEAGEADEANRPAPGNTPAPISTPVANIPTPAGAGAGANANPQ